jgi:mRNA interferase RelE/StbE
LAWTIELHERAERALRKLDRQTNTRIARFLAERVAPSSDPRALGESLSGPLRSYWKYRVGDYRIICDIQDARITVLVLEIGNRRDIYR